MSVTSQESASQSAQQTDKEQSLIKITTIVYALQAASFIFGITYIVAVIINYVKKDDVKDTWLESHFTWQIKTFWYSLLFGIIGAITAFFVIGIFVLIADGIWVIYRIVKGWLNLSDKKKMYA